MNRSIAAACAAAVFASGAWGQCEPHWAGVPSHVSQKGSPESTDIKAVAWFDADGAGPAPGLIYAGGHFKEINGVAVNHIASWNGIEWVSLGSGMEPASSEVYDLTVFDDGTGAALYAAGSFSIVDGKEIKSLARWDGNEWSKVGAGFGFAVIRTLAVFDDGAGPALYAAGQFSAAGGEQCSNIARWDGKSWSSVTGGLSGPGAFVTTLAAITSGSSPGLYAGGWFSAAGGRPASHIARWDGENWDPLSGGADHEVAGIASFADDVYATGKFLEIGGVEATRIARWDGSHWAEVGGGLDVELDYPLGPLATFDDGTGPALYVSRSFGSVGSVQAVGLARWSGSVWSAVGDDQSGYIRDFCIIDPDGPGGAMPGLYCAGGGLTAAGDDLARWVGCAPGCSSAWSMEFKEPRPPLLGGLVTQCVFTPPGGSPLLISSYADGLIGVWDGRELKIIGQAKYGFVRDMIAFDEDGTGPQPPVLMLGGDFAVINGVKAWGLARWDGTDWSQVGNGVFRIGGDGLVFQGLIYSLATVDTDGVGPNKPELFLGGWLDGEVDSVLSSSVLSWDGSVYESVGGGIEGGVTSVAAHDEDGAGPLSPALFVGGYFEEVGLPDPIPAARIARWDGSRWSSLGVGIGQQFYEAVHALGEHDDDGPGGSPPALYAGGEFFWAGGILVYNITAWRNGAWHNVGGGVNDYILAMHSFNGLGAPALYCAGGFEFAGGAAADGFARFQSGSWGPIGGNPTVLNNAPTSFETYDADGAGPGINALYVAGYFQTVNGQPCDGLARWTGAAWAPIGQGLNNWTHTLLEHDHGLGPRLYAGGRFVVAGGVAAQGIAAWDGQGWSPLGSGMNNHVDALAAYKGDLIAGGKFTTAGGAAASRIARWDGSKWSPLAQGVNNGVNGLATWSGPGGEALYAVGKFTQAGGQAASGVAKWNGGAWSALGTGSPNEVFAVAAFKDHLYIGGQFTSVDGVPANGIAKWNGSAWSAVGGGVNNHVYALAVHDDGGGEDLYAAGRFTQVGGGGPVGRIARWNGSQWSAVGTGVNADARALASAAGKLYIGGEFTHAGGLVSPRLASWDGKMWTGLDGGADAPVLALARSAVGGRESVFVGGSFTRAGGVSSPRIARWFACPDSESCYADCDSSGSLAIDDFICFQTIFATGDAKADCDHDGDLDIDDFVCFQTTFALGCP